MRKLILSGSILLSSIIAFGQKEVGFSEQTFRYPTMQSYYKYLNEKDKGKEPIFYTKAMGVNNGVVSIYTRFYDPQMFAANKVAGFSVSSGYTLFPSLGIASFDQSLKPSHKVERIHLYDVWDKQQPYEYEGSKTDKRLADLQKEYPLAFEPFQFKATQTSSRGIGYSFGAKYSVHESTTGVKGFTLADMTPVVDQGKSSEYIVDLKSYPVKLIIQGTNLYNPNTGLWTVLMGENLEGKENKWSEYRNFHFFTADKSGKIIKDDTAYFKYARGPQLYQYAKDLDNPAAGKMVYVFGKPVVMLGGKFQDPDKSKYQLVVLNDDGSLAYKHEFHIGTIGYDFTPVFTYIKNNKVYLLGETITVSGPSSLQLFEADASGIKQVDQDVKTLFGSTKAAINKDWEMYDYKVANDQLFLWGEQKKTIQHETINQQGMKVPAVYNYINFAVVQVDLSNNKIVGQYAFERTEGNLAKQTQIEEAFVTGNKISFVTAENKRTRELSEISGKLNNYSNSQYAKSGLDFLNISRPVLYTADFGAKQAGAYHVSAPDFSSLYPRNSYLIEGNFIYFIGFKEEKEKDAITYQVAKVSLE